MPGLVLEKVGSAEGFEVICGIDEAGRGPWAGPVVAGAVVLRRLCLSEELRLGVDDSKKLKRFARNKLFDVIKREARVGVGIATVEEIDTLNILQATMLAMARAVTDLGMPAPDLALVDGNRSPDLNCTVRTRVRGDSYSVSIAAASIIAKVTRDRIMVELEERYPGYGLSKNAGYGTPQHSSALNSLGVTPIHRKSFRPIRKILSLT